jgi:hypothetical protein
MKKPDQRYNEAQVAFGLVSGILHQLDTVEHGFILSELVANWLSGFSADSPDSTKLARTVLLDLHTKTVQRLLKTWETEKCSQPSKKPSEKAS